MAVFAIPNPKKTLHIDFPLDKIKECAKNINIINSKYRLFSTNEIFNQNTYESFEFLSLGVYIDINLNAVSDNKTEINIEIRRKMGTFNESHEVTHANNHIANIINYLARLTVMSPEEINLVKTQEQKTTPIIIKNKKDKNTATILAFFLGGIGIHRFYLGQTIMGVAYLLFCWTFIPALIAFIDFFAFIFTSQHKFDLKYNQ